MSDKPKTLRDLKVGDTVFVVQQASRGKTLRRCSTEVITKVGRKYGYFGGGNTWEQAFQLSTGASYHGIEGHCTRMNGYGFDVYLCEADYLKEQHDEAKADRLRVRLVDRLGRLVKLTPEVVTKIHAVLDEAERNP